MDSQIYGRSIFFLIVFAIASLSTSTLGALPSNPQPKSHSPTTSSSSTKAATATTTEQINSNSVLNSHYTELAELVEKALLLQTLEEAVGNHNITIFAPKNEALEHQLDPEFKRFLLEPSNLKSLQDVDY